MKPFTKPEIIALILIFAVLVTISVPNFTLSIRRARDQVRRDDLGALVHALDEYIADFQELPQASSDGRIMGCKKPEDKVTIDKKGRLVVNLIPCNWGKDALVDLTPGSQRVFMEVIPGDPQYNKGISYMYFSDGQRYQVLAYMEGGKDEADYDSHIVARNIMCGTNICNVGRAYNVPINISIEQYDKELLKQK